MCAVSAWRARRPLLDLLLAAVALARLSDEARWNCERYMDASLEGRWGNLGFQDPDPLPAVKLSVVAARETEDEEDDGGEWLPPSPLAEPLSAGFHSVGSRSGLPSWNMGGILACLIPVCGCESYE